MIDATPKTQVVEYVLSLEHRQIVNREGKVLLSAYTRNWANELKDVQAKMQQLENERVRGNKLAEAFKAQRDLLTRQTGQYTK